MVDVLLPVIGSVTRAYTLAILAGSRLPQTAYRVAKLGNLSPPNVYLELRRLEEAGIVEQTPEGWVLTNDRVRAFCEGQGPLYARRSTIETKQEWYRRNRNRVARVLSRPIATLPVSKGRPPKVLREFRRSPMKDALLRQAGLRESRHKRP